MKSTIERTKEKLRRPGIVLLLIFGAAQAEMPGLLDHWDNCFDEITIEIDEFKGDDDFSSLIQSGSDLSHAVIFPSDNGPCDVVLRRSEALLNKIKELRNVTTAFEPYESRLAQLRQDVAGKEKDREQFRNICRVRRDIALQNPLLNFDEILFQSYEGAHDNQQGHNNPMRGNSKRTAPFDSAGGLYKLTGFKTDNVGIVDMLAAPRAQNGRYQGKTLSNSNPDWQKRALFNSMALSYDAETLVFGWCSDRSGGGNRNDGHPHPNGVFHLFKMNMDGTGLTQITDSERHSAYQPCLLPNGRIVFISEKLNRQERCGTEEPGGNLFSMKADGSDMFPISWHETNEWYPWVANDGMLLYTRWDYIDRAYTAAHHLWTCYPDGRDPRAPSCNYDYDTRKPMSQMACKPIPGSSRIMGLISGHHSAPFGIVFILDLSVPDMEPGHITYFWPYTEKGMYFDQTGNLRPPTGYMFTEPWPLSEYFCVAGREQKMLLLDRYQNKILLCDPVAMEIGSRFRMRFATPIAGRDEPPALSTHTWQGERRDEAPPATLGVFDVYEAEEPWPQDVKITHLRILSVPPKWWLWDNTEDSPRIGYSNGGIPRMVLGTVPVEEDGSAYFEAPIECEIIIHALDSLGRTVQGMRSGTYVHPGENLTCTGCHEDKWKTPPTGNPKAFSRAPSKIKMDVDGSNPMNYARLAKPVFDRKCTPCHVQTGKGISFEYWKTPEQRNPNVKGDLADYVHYFDATGKSWNSLRTYPMKSGAYGSKLLNYLYPSHHDVDLTDEERRRITLWMDCNALEIGSFNRGLLQEQRDGMIVWPASDAIPWNPTHTDNNIEDNSIPSTVSSIESFPAWTFTRPSAVGLRWQPADDPESGVHSYKVYRDGKEVGIVPGREFTDYDPSLEPATTYNYEIAALNRVGLEGQRSPIDVTTLSDQKKPQILRIYSGAESWLYIRYTEKIDLSTALNKSNYDLGPRISIERILVPAHDDSSGVMLETSGFEIGEQCTLSVSNVNDRYGNSIDMEEAVTFQFRNTDGWWYEYYELSNIDPESEDIPDFSGLSPAMSGSVPTPDIDHISGKRDSQYGVRIYGSIPLDSLMGGFRINVRAGTGEVRINGIRMLFSHSASSTQIRDHVDDRELQRYAKDIGMSTIVSVEMRYVNAFPNGMFKGLQHPRDNYKRPMPNVTLCYSMGLESIPYVGVLAAEAAKPHLLHSPYPNPFGKSLSVPVRIAAVKSAGVFAEVKLFNAAGRCVRTVTRRFSAPGLYTISLDGKDRSGRPLTNGLYVAQIRTGDTIRRFSLLRLQ